MIYLTRIKEQVPAWGEGIRLALYQGERPLGTRKAIESNLEKLEEVARKASRFDVQLLALPELYLSGYALDRQQVEELAEPVDGRSMARVAQIARANRMAIICPYAEREQAEGGERFYDSIALIDSEAKTLLNYRKTHLFGQTERENFSDGAGPFAVAEIAGFPVGVLNCYEAEFPELSRILAVKGAKLIVIPTAADYYYTLADGSQAQVPYPDVSRTLIPARAYENKLFIAYANRYGGEKRGGHEWNYRHNSVIAGPDGKLLLAARAEETLLIGDCVPGDFPPTHPEGDYLKDRRPELYRELISPQPQPF